MSQAPHAVLAQVIAAVPTALAFVDADGSRLFENERMAEVPPAVRDQAFAAVERARTHGLGFVELLDEQERIWRFDFVPADRSCGAFVVVGSDVSAARRMEGRLEELLAAEQMARVMSEHEALQLAHHNQQLEQDASTDPLTGLLNRRAFDEVLEQELARATDTGSAVAVLYFDLDKFKRVNDSLGHAAGDQILAQTAQRLQRCVRAGDVAARLGGDEFALLLCRLPADAAAQVAARVGEQALAAVGEDVMLGDIPFPVGSSIGIAVGPVAGDTREQLVARADEAMYAAKRGGGGTVVAARAAVTEPAA